MKIPNVEVKTKGEIKNKFKKVVPFMPSNTFRMLICGPSGCGKTNTLMYMLYKLLYYDKIYLYSKNLEQTKYKNFLDRIEPISEKAGYDIVESSNDEIMPMSELNSSDSQKIVIFDDFVCEKNQKPLIEYFIGGRHKNCSVIYLSQSYYLTPKDIRLNCSHFCIFDSPSAAEVSRICKETNVDKDKFINSISEPYSFAYIDKINKTIKKNFNEDV